MIFIAFLRRLKNLSFYISYFNGSLCCRWTIKARVTNKSQVRSWSNSRGEGKLFSINLADESGEIRATAFRESVDKFYNFIEVNKVW